MALTPGTRLGPYEIVSALGAGGMGEVYRATDTRLKRQVAIKILPASLAADRERLARFQREAEVLASLNHPNIAGIYGLEATDGSQALVMELVEGEDLSTVIARGPVSPSDALPLARQIADALEAAHEQGIVHRDLKPANIKVRADGTVKVLDFGLAKALEPAGASTPSSTALANAPTITSPAMTQMGMILGTAAYMSPEQARGRAVDKRADIWAFGAVLYEMLTGRRAFDGDDISITLASVLMKDVQWEALPDGLPPALHRLLRRCLERDPRKRLRDIGEARVVLDNPASPAVSDVSSTAGAAAASRPGAQKPAWQRALPWAMTTMLGAAFVSVLLVWAPWRPAPIPPETRLDIVTPESGFPAQAFALSPDGRQIVYSAGPEGGGRLWLRSLATGVAQPLIGTDGALTPFWAPDGRAIAFSAGGSLKRLDLSGGAPQTLAPSTTSRGGTWSEDGVILFVPTATSPIMRVSANGGAVQPATSLAPDQESHRWPFFLPGGQRFLFYVQGAYNNAGLYIGTLDGRAPVRLTPSDGSGVWMPDLTGASGGDGWVLSVRSGGLVAQGLDVERAVLTGEPVTVAAGVDMNARSSAVSVSASGIVAYRTGAIGQRQLAWFDRSGAPQGIVGAADANPVGARLSPDGQRVLVHRVVQGNSDVWVLDNGRMSRMTFDPAAETFPIWSPDGTRILFRSNRSGAGDLFLKAVSGSATEQRLVTASAGRIPSSWSANGFALFTSTGSDQDIWAAPVTGDTTPFVVLKTPFSESWAAFSPDGRWIAYQSDESGRIEVYVRPFVAPGTAATAGSGAGERQVSTAGGIMPVWRRDGKELYYLNPAGAIMATPIAADGAALRPGTPVTLLATHIAGGGIDNQTGPQYDVAPDGRFLINTVLDTVEAPITVVMNWHPREKP